MAGPDLIFANPERLRRFRETADGLADGLDVRRGALTDAVARHRLRTEPTYRVDGDALADDVRGLALALRQLGEWVGDVGAAFEAAGTGIASSGVVAIVPAALGANLPQALVDATDGEGSDDDAFAHGLTLAAAAGAGLRRGDLAAVARALGADRVLGRAAGAVAASPRVGGVAGVVDVAAAARIGVEEGRHRWESEPDREPLERGLRAGVDGLFAGGGAFGGANAGAAIGAALCAPSEVGIPACAATGSYLGGWVGHHAGEWLSDRLLGPEPEAWDQPPDAFAAEVADVDDRTLAALEPIAAVAGAGAAVAAARHADFVVRHPWTADDERDDSPDQAPPITGPR